jgi:hypothetical protein
MNSIETSICDAIELIVDRAISQANYDKTIQATIVECTDSTIGKYKVKYQDSTFYAYAGSTDVSYISGTTVYILVPSNDMSNDKTILGTTQKLGINYVSTIEDEDAYEIIGKNTVSAKEIAVYELSSYHVKKFVKALYDKSYDTEQNLISLNLDDVNKYIKNAGSLFVAANIQTKLAIDQQFRGNYGLIIGLDFSDNASGEEVTRYYALDVDRMRGNPYKILNYTRQYGIFSIDGENFLRVSNISLFVQDFPNSKEEDECEPDIFIKDIELCGAERLDTDGLNNSMLTFLTLQGTYFDKTSSESDTKSIQAQVRIKGKIADATSQKLPFYWFVEHAGITSNNQYYNKYGGQGWKCLNDFNVIKASDEGDTDVVEWVPANDTLIVKKSDIITKEVKYKCAVIYDGTVITRTILIQNLDSKHTIDILSTGTQFYFDIGHPNLTCIVDGGESESTDYIYSWAVIDNSDNFSSLPEDTDLNKKYDEAYNDYYDLLDEINNEKALLESSKEKLESYRQALVVFDTVQRVRANNIFNLNVSSITDFSTYYCTVYNKEGKYIGTASIVLTNSLTAEGQYNLIIHDGSKVYKYNENGVSPASSSVDSPIDISALTFSVYDNLGNIIDDSVLARHTIVKWLVPIEDTMIDVGTLSDDWSYTDSNGTRTYTASGEAALSFPYKIKSRYDFTYTNNDIIITVEYQNKDDGTSVLLSNKTNFIFIKEGENGTNGTDFVCKIVPNVKDDSEEVPAYPMVTAEYSNPSAGVLNYTPKKENQYLKVQLWHNDVKILDGVNTNSSNLTTEDKEVSINWEILKNKYGTKVVNKESVSITDDSAFSVTTDGEFTFNGYKDADAAPANIVKVTVVYEDVTYYATMPIVTARIYNENYKIRLKENTGFFNVLYSSDGQTPKYDNTNPFEAVVTRKIDNIWEDVSTKTTSAYQVTYNWNCDIGKVYESDWVSASSLSKGSTGEDKLADNQYLVKPESSYDGECVTNAIEVVVSYGGNKVCKMHIPVHLMLNRYGNSAINGWDGNSVQVDDEGGYILAPQIGAGVKEKDNSFTGIVMGKVKEANKTSADIGLFGYNAGTRSIFLDAETGQAQFGASGKGQIVIDPSSNKAQIYSGNYSTFNKKGLLIDLTTPEIRFGSGNFAVDSSGYITAKGGGTIAGWKISDDKLTSGNTTLISSGSNERINVNNKFKVYDDGTFSAANGSFSVEKDGSITATKGSIGGWTINTSSLTAKGIEIDSTGTIKSGDNWSISSSGLAIFKNIKADNSGSIGGWTITSDGLKQGNTYITSAANGIGLFSNGGGNGAWSIKNDGSATFSNVAITGGSLVMNGGIAKIDNTGAATFTNITIKDGGSITLGGTTINSSGTKLTESNTKVGDIGLKTYLVDTIQATNISCSNLIAGTVNEKQVEWREVSLMNEIAGLFKEITIDGTKTKVMTGLKYATFKIMLLGTSSTSVTAHQIGE